ncbi:MAG: GNAT family N-acetyltransferase [Ruminococcus sp.]|nr:GNAT family N-acetyltransferase [Oscillospiraceae bacterium]MDY4414164.1 GNAT family N-acetyltransferase [Ruminococcus sp.]
MDITIRKAEVSDAPVICDFIHRLTEYQGFAEDCTLTVEETERLMKKANGLHAVIAEDNGIPIGFTSYIFIPLATLSGRKIIYIEDAFIIEEMRRKGIGKAIFEFIEEIGRSKNCLRLEWKDLSGNDESVKFYENINADVSKKWITYMKKL